MSGGHVGKLRLHLSAMRLGCVAALKREMVASHVEICSLQTPQNHDKLKDKD